MSGGHKVLPLLLVFKGGDGLIWFLCVCLFICVCAVLFFFCRVYSLFARGVGQKGHDDPMGHGTPILTHGVGLNGDEAESGPSCLLLGVEG